MNLAAAASSPSPSLWHREVKCLRDGNGTGPFLTLSCLLCPYRYFVAYSVYLRQTLYTLTTSLYALTTSLYTLTLPCIPKPHSVSSTHSHPAHPSHTHTVLLHRRHTPCITWPPSHTPFPLPSPAPPTLFFMQIDSSHDYVTHCLPQHSVGLIREPTQHWTMQYTHTVLILTQIPYFTKPHLIKLYSLPHYILSTRGEYVYLPVRVL